MQTPSRRSAVLQAVLVTFLWSTSWVLIKIGLKSVPALTFSGLRYILAAACLVPFLFRPGILRSLAGLSLRNWLSLALLGLVFIAITQGAQYIALVYLPSATVSLMLSFSAPLVALLGMVLLAEKPSWLQWLGVAVFLAGVLVYFWPAGVPAGQVLGLAVAAVGVLANSFATVLGRAINRSGAIPPLVVTAVSMGTGALLLLGTGLATEGMPALTPLAWLITAWLAVVNTAFAFTLWNIAQHTLTAVETSLINNTMLIQIAILAWIFLGESLSPKAVAGLLVAAAGTVLVQLRPGRPSASPDRQEPSGEIPHER